MFESYKGVVYPWECDFFNHMNVQHYVAKFDRASWQFLAQAGLTPEYFRRENRGMVAMEQRIRYFKEFLPGDLLHITSELLEVRGKSIKFRHLMYHSISGNLSAEAELISVQINTKTRESCDFAAAIKANLAVLFKEQKSK